MERTGPLGIVGMEPSVPHGPPIPSRKTAVTRDRLDLQEWYREAMLGRIDELVGLRERLRGEGRAAAADELRKVGQALRGSGGTFGFPELSTAAGVVELTSDHQALRRLEGLLRELRHFVGGLRDERARVFEWVAVAVGMSAVRVPEVLAEAEDVEDAWSRVRAEQGLDETEMTCRMADYLGLTVAETTLRSRAARRLLPEAFMASHGIVPLEEDSVSITVATADPVSLSHEVEVRRLTGRRPVFAVAPPGAIGAVLAAVLDEEARSVPDAGSPSVERETSEGGPPGRGVKRSSPRSSVDATRVLVVDDEESARLLVRTLLEKRGYAALEASDGIEALRVIDAADDVGIAVVDLKMPRMDGLELIWELRDTPRWADLPIIVVTGEQDEILETQIMEEGADDYVRKPIDPRLFLARVESTLRRSEVRSSG